MLLYLVLVTTLASNVFCAEPVTTQAPTTTTIATTTTAATTTTTEEQTTSTTKEPISTGLACSVGWTLYKGDKTCLKAFSKKKNFSKARKVCRSKSGDLVIIRDDDKRDFIIDDMNQKEPIFIGTSDNKHNGHFTYVDGSELGDYNPWGQGQPNNYKRRQYCVVLMMKTKTTNKPWWNDDRCKLKYRYVCQKDPEPRPTTRAEIVSTTESETSNSQEYLKCRDCWVHNEKQGVCLKVVDGDKRTFSEAREYCQMKGGDLVTMLYNSEQTTFVNDLLNRNTPYWIGIQDFYNYVNGEPLGQYDAFLEKFKFNGHEFCVDMKDGDWYFAQCNEKMDFVCQRNPE